MKIAMHTNSIIDISVLDQLNLMKENEINSAMQFWYKDIFNNQTNEFPKFAERIGISIENIHVPYYKIDELWKDSLDREDVLSLNLSFIEDCFNHGIETMVMHPIGWKSSIEPSEIALESFKKLTCYAEKKNIVIALENVANSKYIDYLFSNIESESLRFCYDNAHELLMPESTRLLNKYKHKLKAVHLTDNNGVEDLHQLPLDGIENWDRVVSEIRMTDYDGPLAFEVGWQCRNEKKNILMTNMYEN